MPCQTLSSGLPADGQRSGCRGYGTGSVSEIVEKARRTFRSCQHRGLLRDAYQELVLRFPAFLPTDEDSRLPEELKLPTDSNIAREIEQKDEARQVKRLIRQLPRSQQQIILLRDVNDCSYEEIEQVTGLTAVNIRVLLSRARKKIREQFNEIMNYESK